MTACGAKVVSDSVSAARLISQKRQRARAARDVDRIILICDDATSDLKCGLKGDLLNETQNHIGDGGTFVTVVHQGWIYDAISCYKTDLGVANYPPKANLTKGLFEVMLLYSNADTNKS
jgi:hypothetical protein